MRGVVCGVRGVIREMSNEGGNLCIIVDLLIIIPPL